MAKVGNEAKLILRLAKEQMEQRRLKVLASVDSSIDYYYQGCLRGINDYEFVLSTIIAGLEANK